MAKYLWDLFLEDIPCGWQHIYEEALKEYPNGKEIEWVCTKNELIKEWVDPVQAYNLFKKTFLNYKNQALNIASNLSALEIRDSFTQLLEIDVALFNLLSEWSLKISHLQNNGELFRPFGYFNQKLYMNYILYFGTHTSEPLSTFSDMRVVDVNFHHEAYSELLGRL